MNVKVNGEKEREDIENEMKLDGEDSWWDEAWEKGMYHLLCCLVLWWRKIGL